MKKALSKNKSDYWYFDKKGHQVFGVAPPDVWGNLTDVWGNLSNVWGDLSNVWGDLDDCEITAEDREKGIDINTLIKEPAQ